MHIFDKFEVLNHRLVRTFQIPFTPNKSNMFAFATMQTIERVSILESFNIVYQHKNATLNKLKGKGNDEKNKLNCEELQNQHFKRSQRIDEEETGEKNDCLNEFRKYIRVFTNYIMSVCLCVCFDFESNHKMKLI